MAIATPAFQPIDTVVGVPPINASLAVGSSAPYTNQGTPAVPSGIQAINQLGMRIKAWDPNYGVGEFIWLLGVASTIAGSLVTYDETTGDTTLVTSASRGPVAVAMAANTSTSLAGWYQIAGAAVVANNGTAATGRPYASSTAGKITSAATNAYGIDGADITVANSGGLCVVQLDRPSMNGNN